MRAGAFSEPGGQPAGISIIRTAAVGPASMQLASDFFDELARNTARLPELKTIMSRSRVILGAALFLLVVNPSSEPWEDIGSNWTYPKKLLSSQSAPAARHYG